MGMVGSRFGRNVPIEDTFPDTEHLLTPNPRIVSTQLLQRETFQPATTLNLLPTFVCLRFDQIEHRHINTTILSHQPIYCIMLAHQAFPRP